MDPRTTCRLAAGALHHRLSGRRAPLNVMVSVTDRCNARCAYCGIPSRGTPEPTTGQLLDLIDAIADAGAARVAFWGGEPLLRGDIHRLVDRAASRGLWTTLDTNGAPFPHKATLLRRLDHLLISYDGSVKVHDRQRGSGSHARAMAAIWCAAAEGFAYWTLTVLTRHNVGEIEHVLDLAERIGHVAAFQVLHHPPTLTEGRGDDLRPHDAEYRSAIERLIRARERGRPVGNSLASLRSLLEWPDFGAPTSSEPRRHPCLAGKLYCNVDTDGRVYPCSLLVGRVPARSAWDEGFAAAFAEVAEPPCRSCTATAFDEYNRLFGLDPGTIWEWTSALRRSAR